MTSDYFYWNPDPEIINVFGFSLRYYGLMFGAGILLGLIVLRFLFKNEDVPEDYLETLSLYGILGILLGARLGHCFFYDADYFLSHPFEILLPVKFLPNGGVVFTGYQGLASHGGGIGFVIAVYLYAKKTGHGFIAVLDLVAITTGLTAGFIRLANFMNSEIIGIPTNKPWAVVFAQVDNLPRHPTQLYEALCYFLIFSLLLFLFLKKKDWFAKGSFFGLLLIMVFVARFTIEFLKEDQVAFESNMVLNMGQLLSIPYILVGIVFLCYGMRAQTNKNTARP